jgi:hypothetical protein
MTTPNTSSRTSAKSQVASSEASRTESVLRIAFVIVTAVVLALEIIFIVFKIPKRPLDAFDVSMITLVIALIITRPSIYKYGMKPNLSVVSVAYKIFLAFTAYVLLGKVAYFLGFFAAMMFKH